MTPTNMTLAFESFQIKNESNLLCAIRRATNTYIELVIEHSKTNVQDVVNYVLTNEINNKIEVLSICHLLLQPDILAEKKERKEKDIAIIKEELFKVSKAKELFYQDKILIESIFSTEEKWYNNLTNKQRNLNSINKIINVLELIKDMSYAN